MEPAPADVAPPLVRLPAALAASGYALRPEREADLPFLLQLYASTRQQELAAVPWTEAEKAAFLASQFQAQRHHYRTYIPACSFAVIERNGAPAGRLYLEPRRTQIHIVDIALMPAHRGNGVGTAIMQALQHAAHASGRGLGIMVETFNPAMRLYRRLGFAEIVDHGVYVEMEWRGDQLNVA